MSGLDNPDLIRPTCKGASWMVLSIASTAPIVALTAASLTTSIGAHTGQVISIIFALTACAIIIWILLLGGCAVGRHRRRQGLNASSFNEFDWSWIKMVPRSFRLIVCVCVAVLIGAAALGAGDLMGGSAFERGGRTYLNNHGLS